MLNINYYSLIAISVFSWNSWQFTIKDITLVFKSWQVLSIWIVAKGCSLVFLCLRLAITWNINVICCVMVDNFNRPLLYRCWRSYLLSQCNYY